MRTTWQPLRNENKRDDSVEFSRFFISGEVNLLVTSESQNLSLVFKDKNII